MPAYIVTKTLFHYCGEFWDTAKLTEKCVGRLARRGKLLFRSGLPTHARAKFIVAASVACMSEFTLRGKHHLIDCDEVRVLYDFYGLYGLYGLQSWLYLYIKAI